MSHIVPARGKIRRRRLLIHRFPMQRAIAATAVCLALGAMPLRAQQTPAAQAPTPQATFRSGVELVRLDVRVLDDQGRPVKDIRADELTVAEDGEPRPIVLFQHVEEPSGTYVDVARRTIASEVSTNRSAPRGHLYVLVFDQHHLTPGNEQRARQAAERFLRTRVRPGDRVALYALPGPGPQIPFTSDVNRAIAELTAIRGSLERTAAGPLGTMQVYEAYEIARGNEPVLNRVAGRLAAETSATDVLRTATPRPNAPVAEVGTVSTRLVQEDARRIVALADEEARRFLLMFSDLMASLRGIEGRKAVVLISEGFFTDHVSREIEHAAAAAARGYCVVYALDVNRRSDTLVASGPTAGDEQAETLNRLESLGSLALETDGRLVNDAGSRLGQVFDQIARESLEYYVVGFLPSEKARRDRGAYRRVKVKVARGGVRVNTRTGYSLETASQTPADRRRAIDAALAAPFPRQELPIELTTYVLRGTTIGAHRVVMSLAADLPAAGRAAGAADVVFVVRSARDGRVAASGTGAMPLPETTAAGSDARRSTYQLQFDLEPGEYLMRVVVHEPGGLVGSADRRFDVRAFTARDLTASDLVFSSPKGDLAVRPAAYRDTVLSGAVEVYGPSEPDLDAVDVKVDLTPLGAAGAIATVQGDLLDLRLTDQGPVRPVRIEIPLAGIPPGEYVARAVVRVHGGTVAELTRDVEVLAEAPPADIEVADRLTLEPTEILGGELARDLLRSAAERAPAGPVKRAAAMALSGSWREIEAVLAQGAEQPSDAASRLLVGMARFGRREFSAAAEAWEASFAADPTNARIAFLLGWAYAGAGDDRLAIGAWRGAARVDPTLVPAHLAIAEAFVRLSEPAFAVQALRFGLSAVPNSPELLDRLARLDRR